MGYFVDLEKKKEHLAIQQMILYIANEFWKIAINAWSGKKSLKIESNFSEKLMSFFFLNFLL